MGRIHLLDDDVINKIAAGEVVERPASVVKELVENALDAGARSIAVSLELGGVRSIVVTDDGHGMSAEDATAALKRHATSKIRQADDLFRIGTMGFRGEALASIAAVSHFTLTTAEADGDGVKVTVQEDGTPRTQFWNGVKGTTITVEQLFHNIPARHRFLKAPGTEFAHCLEMIQAFALCHPRVSFRLSHNNREYFRVAAATAAEGQGGQLGDQLLRERAKAVLGKDAAGLLHVTGSNRFGTLEALISPPGLERPTGRHLYCFVNRRWVKDKLLKFGIMRGYHSHLMKGRYPVVVLNFTCDPALIDVNVHPAKTELRFQYPSEVQNLISLAIRERLRDTDWAAGGGGPEFQGNIVAEKVAPATTGEGGGRAAGVGERAPARPQGAVRADTGGLLSPAMAQMARLSVRGRSAVQSMEPQAVSDRQGIEALLASGYAAEPSAAGFGGVAAEPVGAIPWAELEFIGAFARCYLLFSHGGRLLAVDQHAFHERVLFERLIRDRALTTTAQRLLVPEALEMEPTAVARLEELRPGLAQRGFEYTVEGPTTVAVLAVPVILVGRPLAELFAELAQAPEAREAEGTGDPDSNAGLAQHNLATIACHAAVRAGEELTAADLRRLIGEAATVDFYHNCPHGRRVFRWFSQAEVARWFDR